MRVLTGFIWRTIGRKWLVHVNAVTNVQFHERRDSVDQISDFKLLKRTLFHGISISAEINSKATIAPGLFSFRTLPASVILTDTCYLDLFPSSDDRAGRFLLR
jgi:hypothetical protein